MNDLKKYKKPIIAAACSVAVVWVCCISFAIAYKVSQNRSAQQYQTSFQIVTQKAIAQNTSPQTQASSQTQSDTLLGDETTSSFFTFDSNGDITQQTTQTVTETVTEQTTKAQEKLTVPKGKDKIISAYIKAVNKLKGTDSFTLVKENEPTVEVVDVTGGSLIRSMVDSSIQKNLEKIQSPATYVFSGGKAADGTAPTDVIAPEGKNAVLKADDAVQAKAEPVDENSYKITINLGVQVQTLEKSAPGYSGVMDVISIDDFDLSDKIEITSLNIYYNKSTIEAVIDKDGRLISMTHDLNINEAVGEGKLSALSSTLKMKGTYHSTYKITY